MAEKIVKLSSHDGFFFIDGSYGVCFERILEYPASRVWTVLTESQHLAQWLAPAELRGGKGGTLSLQLTGGVMGGKITEWRERELLEYAWYNGSTVRWELLTEGEGRCLLVFTHRYVPASQLIDAAKGWHYHLDMLTLVVEGEPVPRDAVAHWDEISREATIRYAAAVKQLAPASFRRPLFRF